MSPFGNSFGEGNPYWNINEVSRETRMNKSREFGSLWHQEVFSGAHQEDDPVKDGELFDFDGRVSSSEGRFPEEFNGLFLTEGTPIFKAKSGFRRCIGLFKSTENLIRHADDLSFSGAWYTPGGAGSVELMNIHYRGYYFTKITENSSTLNYNYVRQPFTEDPNSILSFYIIFKKGTASYSRFLISDGTTDFVDIIIDWSSNNVTASGTKLFETEWDGDVCIITGSTSSIVTSASTIYTYVYGVYNSTTDGTYSYVTAIMVIKSTYPIPYATNIRRPGSLYYEYTWNSVGTIEFWLRPYFDIDLPNWVSIITDAYNQYNDPTVTDSINIDLRFVSGYFQLTLYGSSANVVLTTDSFLTNADLRKWQHVKICWDTVNDEYLLYLNGELSASSTIDIGEWTPNSNLSILSRPLAPTYTENVGDSLISDLLIKSYIDKTDHHYKLGKPYYNPKEITSEDTNFVISPYGIQIKSGGISLKDKENRSIELGGSSGLLARDSQGLIIHDVPTGNLSYNMLYGGHVVFSEYDSYVTTISLGDTTTDTSAGMDTGTIQRNISSVIPISFKNVKGILAYIDFRFQLDGVKVKSDTYIYNYLYYAANNNVIADVEVFSNKITSFFTDAHNIDIDYQEKKEVLIPVFVIDNDFVILIRLASQLYNMTNESGQYTTIAYIYINGFLV